MVSPSGVFLFKAGMVAPGPSHSHSSSLPPGTRVSALLLRPPEAFPGGVSAPGPSRPPPLALGTAELWGQLVLGRGGCLVPREGAAASPVLLRWTDAPSLQLGRPRVPPDAARCFRRPWEGAGGQGRPLPLPAMSPNHALRSVFFTTVFRPLHSLTLFPRSMPSSSLYSPEQLKKKSPARPHPR